MKDERRGLVSVLGSNNYEVTGDPGISAVVRVAVREYKDVESRKPMLEEM